VITLIGTSAESWEKAGSNAVEQAFGIVRTLRLASMSPAPLRSAGGHALAGRRVARKLAGIERGVASFASWLATLLEADSIDWAAALKPSRLTYWLSRRRDANPSGCFE